MNIIKGNEKRKYTNIGIMLVCIQRMNCSRKIYNDMHTCLYIFGGKWCKERNQILCTCCFLCMQYTAPVPLNDCLICIILVLIQRIRKAKNLVSEIYQLVCTRVTDVLWVGELGSKWDQGV